MRILYFLVPGTGGKFACGGLWAELKTLDLARRICPVEVITYRQREKDTLFLDDLLQQSTSNQALSKPHVLGWNPAPQTTQLQLKTPLDNVIFVISWGFDVPKLAARLQPYHVIYHAHSTGYGFRLPAKIPIITVSRNTLGYWGQHAPNSLLYYLPNQISDEFQNLQMQRDIDVLVQTRKSSTYLIHNLIPALQSRCQVYVIDSYVQDLAGLFNRAKVYLYDSAEYWALQGVSEGFGLQPMEALACGCQVFSSMNGGLSDYLDPEFNCYKIAGYSKEYDVQRILHAISQTQSVVLPGLFFEEYRAERITQRLRVILEDINAFFDHQASYSSDIKDLTRFRVATLKAQAIARKFRTRYLK